MNKLIGTLVLLILFFIGCVSIDKGPNKEVKSKLGYLNGKTYGSGESMPLPNSNSNSNGNSTATVDSSASVFAPNSPGIPVGFYGRVNNRSTKLSGTLLVKEDFLFSPINNVPIVLKTKKNQIIHEFKSGMGGHFELELVVPNGSYELTVDTPKYSGALKFEIKSYEVQGLKIITQRK